jgi:glycogen(starch) synthase
MRRSPVRSLLFSEAFWPKIGGLEVILVQLLRGLTARGHEVLVVTDRVDDTVPVEDQLGDVTIRRLPLVRALAERDLGLLADLVERLHELECEFAPDLIHATFAGPSTWYLPRLKSAPLLLDCHGSWTDVRILSNGMFRRVILGAARLTACSQAVLDDMLGAAPEMADRAMLIPPGLEAPVVEGPLEPRGGPPMILASGRMVLEKGLDVALAAMTQIASRRPDARLVLVGDGPCRPALEHQADELGIRDKVTFTGWVAPDRTAELRAEATLVLVPSRSEGFGLVALEAAQMARPVVASDVGGLREVVRHGVTGTLVPVGDARALASAALAFLEDPQLAARYGRAGRMRALTRFSSSRHLDAWDSLYREVAARRKAHGRRNAFSV